jgi:hypothetical protein
MPVMPHIEAGLRIEPPVSVPSAAGRDRSGSRCQTSGLPGRSPVVQQALRDPVPLGNDRNLTALGLRFGHQRRLFLRRPLPAALNHDLAIHSKHSFWSVQKDSASPSTLLSATAGRPVQTGRLLGERGGRRINKNLERPFLNC